MVCDVKSCRKDDALQYAAFGLNRKKQVGVCMTHWEKHCDEEDKFNLIEHFYPSQVAKKKR